MVSSIKSSWARPTRSPLLTPLLVLNWSSSPSFFSQLAHGKYDTVIVFKKKRRTRYERRNGHRQGYTEVLVTELRSGAESAVVDPKVITRNRARVAALAKQKEQNKPLTRKEKIAQGIQKPAKVKKNSLRKAKEA